MRQPRLIACAGRFEELELRGRFGFRMLHCRGDGGHLLRTGTKACTVSCCTRLVGVLSTHASTVARTLLFGCSSTTSLGPIKARPVRVHSSGIWIFHPPGDSSQRPEFALQDLADLEQRCPGFIVSRCKPIKVAMKLRMPGSVSDYTPAKIDAIKADLGSSAGVDASEITIDVQAGSVIVIATMPNSAAAASVAVQIQSGTLTQLGGVAVQPDSFEGALSAETASVGEPLCRAYNAPSSTPSGTLEHRLLFWLSRMPAFVAAPMPFGTLVVEAWYQTRHDGVGWTHF
jgi:hypothetical protein